MVPYKGKLKMYTKEETVPMFIPQKNDGKERLIRVFADLPNRILYIPNDSFKAYAQALQSASDLELNGE